MAFSASRGTEAPEIHCGYSGCSTCWVIEQLHSRWVPGGYVHGLPGMLRDFAAEIDSNFWPLLIAYILAVVASLCGCASAARLRLRVHRAGLSVLCIHFSVQLLVNLAALIGFLVYRCAYHDIQLCDTSDGGCQIIGGGWAIASKLAVLNVFGGGLLTNGLLELGLLLTLQAVAKEIPAWVNGCLLVFVVVQLVALVLCSVCLLLIFYLLITQGAEAVMARIAGTGNANSNAEGIKMAQILSTVCAISVCCCSLVRVTICT